MRPPMKNFLNTFEKVFVYYFASVGIYLLVNIVLNIPLRFIFQNHINLTNFIVGIISMLASLFVLFYRDGYNTKKLELKCFLPSLAVVLLILIAVLFIIGHTVYIAGPTEYLDGFSPKIFIQSPINRKVAVNLNSAALMISAFLVLYTPTILLAEKIGVKNRNKKHTD